MGFMITLEPLCLLEQFLGSRDDDHHVGLCIGMMILIGNIINKLRCWNLSREFRQCLRRIPHHSHIVEAHGSA